MTEHRTSDSDKFRRTLTLTRTSNREQSKLLHIGNQVFIPGHAGRQLCIVDQISHDKQSWRDESGTEHPTYDILV